MPEFEYLPDVGAMIERAAALTAEAMSEAVQARGTFLFALSGGNTPRPVYQRLAEEPYSRNLPWHDAGIYFGDDRVVPPDDANSNYRMAREALLDHVDVSAHNVHRICGETGPLDAARLYDQDLRRLAGQTATNIPRFDLVHLGLGPDGHTASLFPETDVLTNMTDLAAAVHLPASSEGASKAVDRVTMTYPVLNAARHIIFLVAGDDKADALRRVREGDESAPATCVRPTNGTVRWLIVGKE